MYRVGRWCLALTVWASSWAQSGDPNTTVDSTENKVSVLLFWSPVAIDYDWDIGFFRGGSRCTVMMVHISTQNSSFPPAEKQHEGEDLYVMVSTKFCVENVRHCRLYGRALKRWSNCTKTETHSNKKRPWTAYVGEHVPSDVMGRHKRLANESPYCTYDMRTVLYSIISPTLTLTVATPSTTSAPVGVAPIQTEELYCNTTNISFLDLVFFLSQQIANV